MSARSPSKWSEILSVKSSFASKPCQTQASRRTCGTELCTCHLPSPSKWSEILSVISSLASKPYQTQASRHTCRTELCTCHLPSPSKWSEILFSGLRRGDPRASLWQWALGVLQNGPRYCPSKAVLHQNRAKHKLQDAHAALSSAHVILQVLQYGPRYCPLYAVLHQNRAKHKLQDAHAALSSAHVILQVLQNGPRYCSRGFVGGTLGRASDDERSESFKMVRDTVRQKQFCIKTVPNTSIKTHMRHWALHMSSSKSFKMVRDTVRYKQSCIKTVSNTSIKTHMPHWALHMSSSKSFKMVRDIVLGAS